MGQALSNFVASLCGDTDLDEFEIPTRTSYTHSFPHRPVPQVIQTPLSWSRGSDAFTHPVTNSVTNRIVRNPPPGSDPDGYSSSWTREVSQLGLGHLVTRDESDSVRQLGRDPALRWSRGSDSFTHPITNFVTKQIVRNPPPGSDPDKGSSSQTREVSQLGHGHLVIRDESDSMSQLGRDPVISSPKWLEEFLGDSSITVGVDTIEVSEVLKEVRERDEERETFSIPSPIPELIQNPLSSSHGTDLVTHSIPIPPPGSDPVRDLTSPSSESDSVSQLCQDPVISSPKWLEEFLGVSSITVDADTIEESEVLKEVRERDEKRETFIIPNPIPELLQIPLSSSHGSDLIDDLVTHSVSIHPPRSDPVRYSTSSSSESDSVSQLRRDPAITFPKWLDVVLKDSSITVLEEKKEVVREVLREERARDEERGGGAKVERVERWMKHYSNFHKILLVGEGDFSFSACLAVAFGCAHNIIATSLDSRGFLSNNYRNAMSNIESLTSRGAKVIHGVDATQMAKHFTFDGMTFDRIVFNFPHDGCFRNEFSRETQLRRHRKLVRLFMKNAKKMVNKMGEIHISHKSNSFFREWNLEQLATNEGLRLIESLHFRLTDYPGYHTKYGFRGDKNFDCNPSKTYKFGLKN